MTATLAKIEQASARSAENGATQSAAASIREAVKAASERVDRIARVPRFGPLDRLEFRARAKAGSPFLVEGIVEHWPLITLTPASMKERYSELRVRARVGDYVGTAFTSRREIKEMSLAEYVELITSVDPELPPYLGNQQLPALNKLCSWPPYFDNVKAQKIWLGPAGTVTPLHCDYDDNLFAQIWGRKRFLLFPPHHAQYLYARESNPVLHYSKFDPEAPDYGKFPQARSAAGIECVVKPGELLYIPSGWFHHVRALEISLSSNLWSQNRPYVCMDEFPPIESSRRIGMSVKGKKAKTETVPAATTIVAQVKSNRVVYFTDDPEYSPPMDGDWYYISQYLGELPAAMTLRNCWRWRFNGGVFTDTGPKDPAAAPKVPLLEHNRRALLEILFEKIDGVRSQYAPSCIMGAIAREQKLRDAKSYLSGGGAGDFPLLESVAVARNISLLDAAHLVTDRAAAAAAALAETERIRERFALAVAEAKSEGDLLALRDRLLDEVYPRMTEKFAYKLEKTEPVDPDSPLGPTHLRHEQMRLRVQLREAINARRTPWISQYALDDVVSRHKGVLAERLLVAKGNKTEGIDYAVLENHAQARGVTLVAAARDVLKELSETGRMLAETEKLKDTLLAEIAAARTLNDMRRVSAKVGGL